MQYYIDIEGVDKGEDTCCKESHHKYCDCDSHIARQIFIEVLPVG